MNIDEIKSEMNDIMTEGRIVEKSEPRRVRTRFGLRSVAKATLEDKTGRIKLVLWEENIEKIDIGDKVKVSGSYVTEFRGQLQLNIPSFEKLLVLKKSYSDYPIDSDFISCPKCGIISCFNAKNTKKCPNCGRNVTLIDSQIIRDLE
jgi:replication factor A1